MQIPFAYVNIWIFFYSSVESVGLVAGAKVCCPFFKSGVCRDVRLVLKCTESILVDVKYPCMNIFICLSLI